MVMFIKALKLYDGSDQCGDGCQLRPDDGSTANFPGLDCESLFQNFEIPSGIRWIDPDGGSVENAYQVYYESDFDNGGWTLAVTHSDDSKDTWTKSNQTGAPMKPSSVLWKAVAATIPVVTRRRYGSALRAPTQRCLGNIRDVGDGNQSFAGFMSDFIEEHGGIGDGQKVLGERQAIRR